MSRCRKADSAQGAAFHVTKGHHWLLDAALEFPVPLAVLGAANFEEALNRPHHGCAIEEIAHSISILANRGEVRIRTGRADRSGSKAQSLSEEHILDRIKRPPLGDELSWYELTARGGAAWEGWARPDWGRYNDNCERIVENSASCFTALLAANESIAEELLELERQLNQERIVIDDSIKRRVLRQWRATYWKTLPQGHLIAFRTSPRADRLSRARPQSAWNRWCALRRWYERPPL